MMPFIDGGRVNSVLISGRFNVFDVRVRSVFTVADSGPVAIKDVHSEFDPSCTLMDDLLTFLSASLLRANMYWPGCWGRRYVERDRKRYGQN